MRRLAYSEDPEVLSAGFTRCSEQRSDHHAALHLTARGVSLKRACTAVLVVAVALAAPAAAAAAQRGELPAAIGAVMEKPRYENARWSLLVADVKSGDPVYALDPDRMSFAGSTRKLFSTGVALDALGARHRELTPVYRRGRVDARGVLHGDLVLVGGGDLTFGGRRLGRNEIQYTDFDHNDANSLGAAILTPQDPLYALNRLARAATSHERKTR
jgi:D-alanyl-D-alanine carboxypeptidase